MKTLIAVVVAAVVYLSPYFAAKYPESSPDDERVLSLVLEWSLGQIPKNETHIVISPITRLRKRGDAQGYEEFSRLRNDVVKYIHVECYDVGILFTQLIERNTKPVRVKFARALEKRFVIDKDDTFPKYFQDGGGGWDRWHKDNPKALAYSAVSLPVVDKDRGFVMIYIESKTDERIGRGTIYLLKQEGGKLVRLGYRLVWMT